MRSFNPDLIPSPFVQLDRQFFTTHDAIDLEIGAGNGQHALSYARQNPQRVLLAVERTKNRHRVMVQRFSQQQTQKPLNNLLIFRADAVNFVTHLVPPRSLSRIFILYPNPYPKPRQSNLRWHNMPFMGFLLSRLRARGDLTLATNVETYHNEIKNVLTSNWNLQLIDERLMTRPELARTAFEHKYLLRQEKCWNLVFQNHSCT